MQSVHESFTNTDLTNLTDWLAQTGFYEHESHESHELIIMTTNLTNWLVAQGRIT